MDSRTLILIFAGLSIGMCTTGMAEDLSSCSISDNKPIPLAGSDLDKFLGSIGINIHIAQGYEPGSYVEPLRYLGVRKVRDGNRNIAAMISVSRSTGVLFNLIAGADLEKYLSAARDLALSNSLASIEGPNEPNNFPITYRGIRAGGSLSWYSVAQFQNDLFKRVKADPLLSAFPVLGVSEVGAETDNVGLQFLTIPEGAGTIFPDNTTYADFANVHNYVSGVRSGYGDNQAWNASDPTLRSRWDGLAGNHGSTWKHHYLGYGNEDLEKLPRITTETGFPAGKDITEQHIQGAVLVNTYLAQFARGWSTTYVYQLRDNEGGSSNQGVYVGNKPKLAADYIHNLTNILGKYRNSPASQSTPISIWSGSPTVHAMRFANGRDDNIVVLWGERATGSDSVLIRFEKPVQLTEYDVTSGTEPVKQVVSTREECISVSDHALILKFQRR